MNWKTGDKLRILFDGVLDAHEYVTEGGEYDVVAIDNDGTPIIEGSHGSRVYFYPDELPYVERVLTAVDYAEIARRAELGSYGLSDVERNAELGQPSMSPSEPSPLMLTEIYNDVRDIKAMIGRLLKNGGDEE